MLPLVGELLLEYNNLPAIPPTTPLGDLLNELDDELSSLSFKNAVRVATTAPLGALSGLLTVDGVTLVAGDRVLVKDQAAAATNGIYVAAAGAWTRSTDADVSSEVTAQLCVRVSEGTVNRQTSFVLNTPDPIVLGTTSLLFEQYGSEDYLTFKRPVRLASTSNLSLSGLGPVDGTAVVAGDRILAAGQTTPSENGIYVVGTGAWLRAKDANSSAKVRSGMFGLVETGATNAGKSWKLTTLNPIVLGTTALAFTLAGVAVVFAGQVNAAGDITTNSSVFTDVTGMSITPADAGDYLIVFLTDVMADASGQSVEIILTTGNPGTEITNSRRTFTRVADNIRVTHGTAALVSGLAAGTLLKARWRRQPAGGPNMITMGNRIMFVLKVA